MKVWKKINDLNISDENKIKFILQTGTKELIGVRRYQRTIVPFLEDLFSGRICRPTDKVYSGNYSSGYDVYIDITNMLNALNLPYERGNDAARGGKNGNWIKLKNW